MRFSNSRDADCSPPTSAGPIPAGVTLYFIMQSPVSPLHARLQPALGPAHSSECTGLRFLYEHIVDVTLTCMAALLLGSPPHLHRLFAASIPPPRSHVFSRILVLPSIPLPSCLSISPVLLHPIPPQPSPLLSSAPPLPPSFQPFDPLSFWFPESHPLHPPFPVSMSHTHTSSRWFLRLLLLLRNAAPQCVDVIITQHPLLLWNTDEQQAWRQQRSNRQACEKNNHMLCGSRASRRTRIFTFFSRSWLCFVVSCVFVSQHN